MISPQIATTSLTCQRLPRLSSGCKVQNKLATSMKINHPWWSKSRSAHATLETWTWAPSATWAPPPWQCGNQASWRPTATWPPLTSTRPQGHSDWNTQTPWVTGSSYRRSPRCVGQIHLRSEQTHQDQVYYSAYEKDIAIVTFFFGEPTVFGESQSYFYQEWAVFLQSSRGCQRWLGWTSSPASAVSVDFALGWALCLLLRFSTGFLSGFW